MPRKHLDLKGLLEMVSLVRALGANLEFMIFGSQGMDAWFIKSILGVSIEDEQGDEFLKIKTWGKFHV